MVGADPSGPDSSGCCGSAPCCMDAGVGPGTVGSRSASLGATFAGRVRDVESADWLGPTSDGDTVCGAGTGVVVTLGLATDAEESVRVLEWRGCSEGVAESS
jgi:hypothetical protein